MTEAVEKTEEDVDDGEGAGDQTIRVGRKPVSRYLTSCFTILNKGNDTLWIEGMGQNISKVVDIVNYFKRFHGANDVEISDFNIDMVQRDVVHGLPKHVSKLRVQLRVL